MIVGFFWGWVNERFGFGWVLRETVLDVVVAVVVIVLDVFGLRKLLA